MLIYHPGQELGYKTADLVVEMLKGNKIGAEVTDDVVFNGGYWIPAYYVKSGPITKENIKLLIYEGVYSWEQIRE